MQISNSKWNNADIYKVKGTNTIPKGKRAQMRKPSYNFFYNS